MDLSLWYWTGQTREEKLLPSSPHPTMVFYLTFHFQHWHAVSSISNFVSTISLKLVIVNSPSQSLFVAEKTNV